VARMGEIRELHTAVVPKMRFADPKGFTTSSQGIRGYISVMAALKFTNFMRKEQCLVKIAKLL